MLGQKLTFRSYVLKIRRNTYCALSFCFHWFVDKVELVKIPIRHSSLGILYNFKTNCKYIQMAQPMVLRMNLNLHKNLYILCRADTELLQFSIGLPKPYHHTGKKVPTHRSFQVPTYPELFRSPGGLGMIDFVNRCILSVY